MILIDGNVFYAIGTYYVPPPNPRPKAEILTMTKGQFFAEYAANGGNLLIWPCFHFDLPGNPPAPPRYNDYFPCDVTDTYREPPNDITTTLTAAHDNDVMVLANGSVAYDWSSVEPDMYIGDIRGYIREVHVDKKGTERDAQSRAQYFADIKADIVSSAAEDAFFGWGNFHESAWRPWKNYFCWDGTRFTTYAEELDAYLHIRQMEDAAGGSRPVVIEESIAAITADLLRQYHGGCDVLWYNVRVIPAPLVSGPEPYLLINNAYASVTGDCADLQFWSVDAAKPVGCCVDAVWWTDYLPQPDVYYAPWYHQVRFMTYDAVIHRANGLSWGAWHWVYPPNAYTDIPEPAYEVNVKPVVSEVGVGTLVHDVLKAPFDDTMVEAVVRMGGTVVERTAFVGGDLAPKSHICSGRYLMEGCVKYYDGDVYLIAACREGRATPAAGETPPEPTPYNVTFRPYYSGVWAATQVEVLDPGGVTYIPVVNDTFADTFVGEDVHIYRFPKPTAFGE